MKLAMLDKGTKVVAVREVLQGGMDVHVKERAGKLVKAHIAPVSLGNDDGRLMVLVVKWHSWHDKGTSMGGVWHKPMVAVYVGRCNTVIGRYSVLGDGEGEGEESRWDVMELIRLEGSVRVADSVRHIGQLVSQSLVGAV